jgi:hypothetical protein
MSEVQTGYQTCFSQILGLLGRREDGEGEGRERTPFMGPRRLMDSSLNSWADLMLGWAVTEYRGWRSAGPTAQFWS